MRTAAQFVSIMTHALGKTPQSAHDLYQTLNMAGRALFAFDWSWKATGPTQLDATASQSYITLPTDFEQVISIERNDGQQYRVQVLTMTDLQMLRDRTDNYGGRDFWCAFVYQPQASTSTLPLPRMELFPTPSASTSGVFNLWYQRTWKELSIGSPSDLPNIPNFAEQALVHGACALAYEIENKSSNIDRQLYDRAIQELLVRDTRTLPNAGIMRGGADRFRGPCATLFGRPIRTCEIEATFNTP